MGTRIREKRKGSGVYYVFVIHQKNRISKKAGSYAVAEALAKRIDAQLLLGDLSIFNPKKEVVQEKPKTFNLYADSWIDRLKLAEAKPATLERYQGLLDKIVLPVLGERLVCTITRKTVKDILKNARREKYSRSSIALIRTVMAGPLDEAVDDEEISTNPTFKILKSLSIKNDKKKVTPFSAEEASLIMDTAKEIRPQFADFFEFLFNTGVRLGEALALTWDNVFFKKKYAHIDKTFRREINTPKHEEIRDVDLSRDLVKKLKSRRLRQKKEALEKGCVIPDLVFGRTEDRRKHVNQNSIRNSFKAILKALSFPHHRVHDCRHTYATIMISNRVPINYVSNQLGHSKVSITLDTYTTWLPKEDREDVDMLAKAYKSA